MLPAQFHVVSVAHAGVGGPMVRVVGRLPRFAERGRSRGADARKAPRTEPRAEEVDPGVRVRADRPLTLDARGFVGADAPARVAEAVAPAEVAVHPPVPRAGRPGVRIPAEDP